MAARACGLVHDVWPNVILDDQVGESRWHDEIVSEKRWQLAIYRVSLSCCHLLATSSRCQLEVQSEGVISLYIEETRVRSWYFLLIHDGKCERISSQFMDTEAAHTKFQTFFPTPQISSIRIKTTRILVSNLHRNQVAGQAFGPKAFCVSVEFHRMFAQGYWGSGSKQGGCEMRLYWYVQQASIPKWDIDLRVWSLGSYWEKGFMDFSQWVLCLKTLNGKTGE